MLVGFLSAEKLPQIVYSQFSTMKKKFYIHHFWCDKQGCGSGSARNREFWSEPDPVYNIWWDPVYTARL